MIDVMTANAAGRDGRIRVLQLGGPMGMFGAERWILALSRHLPREEVQSFIGVVKDAPGGVPPLCDHAQRLGLPTVVFEAPGKLSLSAIPQLRRFIRRHGIDILHTHGYKTDILGALATRCLSCKWVSTPHGWSTDAGLKVQVYEALDRLSFALCDGVAALSEDLMAGLKRLPWTAGSARLITNGVDLSDVNASIHVDPEIAAFRQRGGKVVGYVGQLIARKRVDTLIRAFARNAGPDVRLYILGDGQARAELEALARELGVQARIFFPGFREDRLDFLRGFDVFVLPSALEGIPRCLMEAMAAGVPVIGSDIEGNRALIRDGETGLLFPLGDEVRLAEHLRALLDEGSMRATLATKGRDLVYARFSAERMARDYLRLFKELLGTSSSLQTAR